MLPTRFSKVEFRQWLSEQVCYTVLRLNLVHFDLEESLLLLIILGVVALNVAFLHLFKTSSITLNTRRLICGRLQTTIFLTYIIMDPIHIHSRITSWRAIISALFEDIATRVYSVDLQDVTVFSHGEYLTRLGMTFVWVREIPNISKTFQNTCSFGIGIVDAGQCGRQSWCVMGPNPSSLCRDRTSPYQSYISSTER